MIFSTLVRSLEIDPASHPRGQPHISSASGLAIVGDWFYIVADDENHLIALRSADVEAGSLRMLPLLEARLPTDPAERKRRKRDLEALFHVPGDEGRPPMLVAWGSGSRAQRDFAYIVGLDSDGSLAGAARAVSLTRLHDVLRSHVGELNIEAGLVQGDDLCLFSRANRGAPANGCFRLDLGLVIGFLLADEGAAQVPPVRFAELDLGRIGEVPVGITDATPLVEGGWLLSAVAEDTSNAYDDGRCAGAVLAACDASGKLTWTGRLDGGFKVEGIAFDEQGTLWLTTDADDPSVPSGLRRLRWPPPGQQPQAR
ncbi:hypothetical protein GLA29479_3057 [Lysobacter antibioticus]|uniref:DUF6929 family protein n=1 Tax=Lysobacter antibioticus TaxID=84531 RepID=UPI000716FF75|nr:hypothetical protein [Lysobacter antibioticus]ALN63919.1 hypothetical protein GLA29479_3057 [Lysobacter antibioticus]